MLFNALGIWIFHWPPLVLKEEEKTLEDDGAACQLSSYRSMTSRIGNVVDFPSILLSKSLEVSRVLHKALEEGNTEEGHSSKQSNSIRLVAVVS